MPPPIEAISSYDLPETRIPNSFARLPEKMGWVWESTKPGVMRAPSASISSSAPPTVFDI